MKIYTYIFLLVLATNQLGLAQTSSNRTYPEIGHALPNFTLKNVSDYGSKTMTLTDFKGRHVILFFWSKYCANCIDALPVVDALQREFKQNVNFFIIGDEDQKGSMQPVFEKARKKFRLRIPYAFDSAFFKSIVPRSTPHLIWINDLGIIKAISSAEALSDSNITKFIQEEPFNFVDRSYSASLKPSDFDFSKPFLTDGNLGADNNFLFRSVLIKSSPEMPCPGFQETIDWFGTSYQRPGLVQGCGTVEELYMLAYTGYSWWNYGHPLYGKFYPVPLIKVNDSSDFRPDFESRKGYFCYSLSLPEENATREQMMAAMQGDLAKYFGYNVSIQKKKLPVWKLYATPEATQNLKSTSSDRSQDYFSWMSVKFTNISMGDFIERIFNKHFWRKPAILNETKIDFNIDVELEANLLDINDLQIQLKKLGLHLTQDVEAQDVVVITAPTTMK